MHGVANWKQRLSQLWCRCNPKYSVCHEVSDTIKKGRLGNPYKNGGFYNKTLGNKGFERKFFIV
jgi:hypothetical protein